MNYFIPFFLFLFFFTSCDMPESHSVSGTERAKINTLQQELHCEILRSFSHESFHELPDLELTFTGFICPADSVSHLAEYIANTYHSSVDYKGKYEGMIVNMEPGSEGKAGVGGKRVFRFRLDR